MNATQTLDMSPNSLTTEKVKINKWLSKWVCIEASDKEVSVDAPEIVAVLQAIGFKLTSHSMRSPEETEKEKNGLTASVSCAKSGINFVMTMDDISCKCLQHDNLSELNQDCSKILPQVSKESASLIRGVIFKLFSIIGTSDINQNNLNETKPCSETCLPTDAVVSATENQCATKDNQQIANWEVDPKTSPPIGTSSPLPKHAKTVDHASYDLNMVADLLHETRNNIEKAMSLLPSNNNTFIKSIVPVKRVSNISPASPRTPTRAAQVAVNVLTKSGNKRMATPKKITSPKKLTPKLTPSKYVTKITPNSEKLARRFMMQPRPALPRKFHLNSPSNDDKLKFARHDTPRPGTDLKSKLPTCNNTPNSEQKNFKSSVSRIQNFKSLSIQNMTDGNNGSAKKCTTPSFSKIPNFAFKKPK